MINYHIMTKAFNVFYIIPIFIVFSAGATPLPPDVAISNARTNCGAISQSFGTMKTMAQINTAVTGIGTAAGAGATIVGITKANIDKQIEKLISDVQQRESMGMPVGMPIDEGQDFIDQTMEMVHNATKSDSTKNELEQRSKKLGNWRTGLLAGSTATNIAGTIIAASNKTDQDLRTQLNKCIQSINDLRDSKIQAQINNEDSAVLQKLDNIINACRDYDTLDISKIDAKAKNASISSGVGVATGIAGTITSATANSDRIRNDDTETGITKEKNLNTASNVLAAGTTVASGVATVFNAQQINTLKKAQKIAIQCIEALNQ